MPVPRIKICCIASVKEAWTAIDSDAPAVGLVSEMPSRPGVIPGALIAEIAGALPQPSARFCSPAGRMPVRSSRSRGGAGSTRCRSATACSSGADQELREALPGISIVQVVHVRDEGAPDEALRVAPHVHALLVDSGTTPSPVKQLGGAGRTHDWALGREIKFQGRLLFLSEPLAGGLVGLKPIDDGIRSILFSTTLPQRPRIPRRSKMFHLCFPSRPLPMSPAVRGAA